MNQWSDFIICRQPSFHFHTQTARKNELSSRHSMQIGTLLPGLFYQVANCRHLTRPSTNHKRGHRHTQEDWKYLCILGLIAQPTLNRTSIRTYQHSCRSCPTFILYLFAHFVCLTTAVGWGGWGRSSTICTTYVSA